MANFTETDANAINVLSIVKKELSGSATMYVNFEDANEQNYSLNLSSWGDSDTKSSIISYVKSYIVSAEHEMKPVPAVPVITNIL